MKVFVTGGAGYIGSHMALSLLDQGHDVVILDNLSKGIKKIVPNKATFIEGDICNLQLINNIFSQYKFDAVTHFAGSTEVEKSIKNPAQYYNNNTFNTLKFVEILSKTKIRNLIFSSTAAVYKAVNQNLINEEHMLEPNNPYGSSKLMCEKIIKDIAKASDLKFFILRYFNVGGADPLMRSGQINENATHLIKICVECALKKRKYVEVFGNNYETPDGSCVRDFIHVSDLISGHILALKHLINGGVSDICNLGYGEGLSVFEIIDKVKSISGNDFHVKIGKRREGDSAHIVANCNKIKNKYNWKPTHNDINKIIKDAFKWEKKLDNIVK